MADCLWTSAVLEWDASPAAPSEYLQGSARVHDHVLSPLLLPAMPTGNAAARHVTSAVLLMFHTASPWHIHELLYAMCGSCHTGAALSDQLA